MKRPSIMTIVVIICIIIIGMYAMGEVNYFASKIVVERNVESPTVVIPSIGVQEKINNVSLNQGVFHELDSYNPDVGDVLIFGHRTLQGSPFLRLNEIHNGDSFLLEWPGIGELKYNVIDTTIVPASYELNAQEGGKNVYLITCDPIGSTENRLIVKGELVDTQPINTAIINSNPQESNALFITAIFLVVGLIFSFFYPKDNRAYILATVLIITAILAFCCIHPIPSELIYDKIIFLNGGL
ncbi:MULTISPECIES: sortase [unclassified Methanobrevibacter]|uniref:sortase n=1 Tax=unclassified Methanobrevibacter TaxID=2638681 RepID=UPI001D3AF175|nr:MULTISPECIES: sortase [unclassified Methanobrevibacter]MBE6491939.1 sortase [Methanobrevibacter sp.]MEE0941684.1 sortase [Methanobrevibacter sp.]